VERTWNFCRRYVGIVSISHFGVYAPNPLLTFTIQVDKFNRLLDEASQLLGTVHSTYTSADAPRQVNISNSQVKRVSSNIRHALQFTIPSLENIFLWPQGHIEKRLAQEIYPHSVKHVGTCRSQREISKDWGIAFA
jgi:hypothetical protein